MRRILIRADPELSDLIPGFIANKLADIQPIVAAANAGDFDALSRIGHRLKGEGGSYGFDSVSEYGAEIERAAKMRDAAAVLQCAARLAEYLETVEIKYE
ncbi:MAG TPA: Hpt domain-containing protein [Candidatus Binataceae bacterium]|nr:Hpt domain-containing protein [Candidatus Binataceae bacterium]